MSWKIPGLKIRILLYFFIFLCVSIINHLRHKMKCIYCCPLSWWSKIKDQRIKYCCFGPPGSSASPGADNYVTDPLSYRASSLQPIHLWALQLSEPSQPHCCEWQFVQRRNLSVSKIPTVMSQSPTVPISHLGHEGPSEVDRVVKGVQLALGIATTSA